MNRKSGFTAAEVFMMLLLLAAVSAIIITPVHRLVEQLNVRPLEVVVLSAVRDAHFESRSRNTGVFLFHLAESNVLRIAAQDGVTLADFPYAHAEDQEGPEILFYRILPEDPQRVDFAFEREDDPVETIFFHPSGVSTPFEIHLREARKRIRLVMDPFSSHPIEREEER